MAEEGESLLHAAQKNGIDLEGACGGKQVCSTCHCILEHKIYTELEEPSEDELETLDHAYGLRDTSRLGC